MAEVEKMYVSVGAKTDELKKGFSDAQNMVKNLASTLGVAFGAREIIRFTGEAVKLSGVAEGVAAAFERIATPGLMDELVRATKGTVSQLELMKQAVQANNFKIPLDVLTKGLEFATRRAKETGQSVDYLTQSFVTGLGRKSVMILDNLGISSIQLQEEVKKTGDFAKAVGNIMSKEMATAGPSIDTVADKTARMNANWLNTKKLLGDVAVEAVGAKEGLDGINESLEDLNTVLADEDSKKNLGDIIKLLIASNPLFAVLGVQLGVVEKAIDKWAESLEDGWTNANELYSASGNLKEGIKETLPTLEDALKLHEELAEAMEMESVAMAMQMTMAKEYSDFLKTLATSAEDYLAAFDKPPAAVFDTGMFDEVLAEEANVYDEAEILGESYAASQESMAGRLETVHTAIAQSFASMGDAITTSMANMITGDTGVEGFFNNLIKLIVDAAVELGKVLLMIGTAMAIVPALEGPAGAFIAGGLGLMLAGKVAGNIIANRAESSGGGSASLMPATQSVHVSGQFRVAGRDLVSVLERGNSFTNATR